MSAIFSRTVSFLGRNGWFNSTGLVFSSFGRSPVPKTITIEPITSRNQVGRCAIEIPAEDVPAVIRELQMQAGLDTLGETQA